MTRSFEWWVARARNGGIPVRLFRGKHRVKWRFGISSLSLLSVNRVPFSWLGIGWGHSGAFHALAVDVSPEGFFKAFPVMFLSCLYCVQCFSFLVCLAMLKVPCFLWKSLFTCVVIQGTSRLHLLSFNGMFLAATKQLYEWYFLSVFHTFLTMFPSSDHHEIFRSYYQWPKWGPCKKSRSEVKGEGQRCHNPT